MARFADHSQHMKVSWAEIGPEDGKKLRTLADAYWQARQKGNKRKITKARDKLSRELAQLDSSLERLLKDLPEESLAQCRPQLEQLRRIVRADLLGLSCLAGEQNKDENFSQALAEVKNHEQEAIISEKSARALLTELEEALR